MCPEASNAPLAGGVKVGQLVGLTDARVLKFTLVKGNGGAVFFIVGVSLWRMKDFIGFG